MVSSERRVLYKKYRIQGYSGIASAVKAGYALSTAQCGRMHKRLGDDMALALEKQGFTNQLIASKIIQRIDSENEAIGHKYMETGLKLAGKLKNDSGMNVDRMQVNVYLPSNTPPNKTIDI